MNLTLRHSTSPAPHPVALATLAGLALSASISGTALAGNGICDVAQWGMPDLDQRRTGLANNGSNHCVPTSNSNVLGYFATHGVPQAFPGVDKTYGQEDYAQITSNINLLGSFMNTSGTGGTGGTAGYNGLVAWVGLLTPGKFGVVRLGGTAVNPSNFIVYRNLFGGYLSPCYGRYSFVGGSVGWNRTGGHCITLQRLDNACSANPTFSYRDPAADEGNVANRLTQQSSSGFTTWSLTKETNNFESSTKTLWRMNTNANDGVKRMLDGLYIILPNVAINTSGGTVNFSQAFSPFNAPAPASVPTGATILGLSLASDLASIMVVHPNRFGAPSVIQQVNLADNSRRVITSVSSKLLATGRRGQVYGIDNLDLVATDSTPQPPLPPVEIARVNLGTAPEGIAVHPLSDEVAVFIPGGTAGPRIARYSKNLTPLGSNFYPSLPGTGELKIKPGPQPGQWYLAREGDGSVRLLLPPVSSTAPYTNGVPINLPGVDVLNDFHFQDGGLVYSVPVPGNPSLFTMKGAKLDTNNRWVADPANPFNNRSTGPILLVIGSQDNYDTALDGPDDSIGPNPEVFPNAQDCVADIAGAGVVADPDGELTADDIILFIRWFTTSDERADVAGPGPVGGPDGELTADDIIYFIGRFTDGC